MLDLNATVQDVFKFREGLTKKERKLFDVMIAPDSFLYDDSELLDKAGVADAALLDKIHADPKFMAAVNVAAEELVSLQLYKVQQAQAYYAQGRENAKERANYLKRYDPTEADTNGGSGIVIINDLGE